MIKGLNVTPCNTCLPRAHRGQEKLSKKKEPKKQKANSFLFLISTRAEEEKSTGAIHLQKLARCSGDAPKCRGLHGKGAEVEETSWGAECQVLATVGGCGGNMVPGFTVQMSQESGTARCTPGYPDSEQTLLVTK